jgi:NAD-dependent dihydropyrimidine dehydrogenase PreA subunit
MMYRHPWYIDVTEFGADDFCFAIIGAFQHTEEEKHAIIVADSSIQDPKETSRTEARDQKAETPPRSVAEVAEQRRPFVTLQMTDRQTPEGRRIYKVRGKAVNCALCEKTIPVGADVTKGVAGDSWAPVCYACRPLFYAETEPQKQAGIDRGGLDVWAIVELMGRQKIAGKISEQVIAGQPLLRVDVPAVAGETAFTCFYSGRALYAITPVAEEIAIAAARQIKKDPIVVWGVRTAEIESGDTGLHLPSQYDPMDYEPPDPDPDHDCYGPPEDDEPWV